MDITSFILGISSVIVVALVTGAVIGLVKIKRMNQEIRSIGDMIHSNYRVLMDTMQTSVQNIYQGQKEHLDEENRRWDEHYRSLDSRLDKLISRIQLLEEKAGITKGKKQLLND